jgi:hypothetical protein
MSAEQSKAVARRYFEEIHTGRIDGVLEEIMDLALRFLSSTTEPVRPSSRNVRENPLRTVKSSRGGLYAARCSSPSHGCASSVSR